MRPTKQPNETWETFLSRLEAWETSPDGKAFLASARSEQAAELDQAHAAHRKRNRLDAGIPEAYWFMDVDQPGETGAVNALREKLGALTVLSGGIGCGKTAAACWWLSRVDGGRFITAGKLSRISKWGSDVDELTKATRVVIDDLGVEFLDEKGFFMSLLDELLNERNSRKRLTVITTNLLAEVFASRYKGRIVDRINEFEGFVSLSGGSLRGAKQLGLLPPEGMHR